MSYIIINDLHFGLQRKAGATVKSMAAFQEMQFEIFGQALQRCTAADTLVILGDLFAAFRVDYDVLWRVREMLAQVPGNVILVQGNHDISKDREQMSALQFLGRMLQDAMLVEAPMFLEGGRIAIVPHRDNQETFDVAISRVAETAEVLLTHCNYNNFFAENSDHSLNLTPEQAAQFELVILGHEHVRRVQGNVHVLGSPWPCNIQEAEHDHYFYKWSGETTEAPVTYAKSWLRACYAELDWRSLTLPSFADFVRVTGSAEVSEAATLIQELNRFRTTSPAYMITSSVKVGELQLQAFEEASESLETFNPMQLLLEALPEKYQVKLKELGYV